MCRDHVSWLGLSDSTSLDVNCEEDLGLKMQKIYEQ
jgi:hypothetical protein